MNIAFWEFYLFLSVEGLHAIVITDRDGVPVIKGKSLSLVIRVACLLSVRTLFEMLVVLHLQLPMTMHPNTHCGLLSYLPLLWQLTRAASWACPKIRASFATTTHIRYRIYKESTFDLLFVKFLGFSFISLQIVQFNRLPLVISFIASSNANTGKS